MEKFRYQFIFEVEKDNLVIFHGTTTLSMKEVLERSLSYFCSDLADNLTNIPMVNCIYEPIKSTEDESKKSEER